MQNNDFRAKQFMPFDSLKGFYNMIKYQEKIKNSKKTLDEYSHSYLNEQIKSINKNDKVIIKHYYNTDYIETIDIVKKIDIIERNIYLKNSVISFDNIIDIKNI